MLGILDAKDTDVSPHLLQEPLHPCVMFLWFLNYFIKNISANFCDPNSE